MKKTILFVGFLAVGCLGNPGDDEKFCGPGTTANCPCEGTHIGTKVCLQDGSAWSECECTCEQDCSGRLCGPDPVCGRSCGECLGEELCTVVGQCISGCTPDCSAQDCGPDPVCGVPCGTCQAGEICSEDFQCFACEPDCEGLLCGPDPNCNTMCAYCQDGKACFQGSCVEAGNVCDPVCDKLIGCDPGGDRTICMANCDDSRDRMNVEAFAAMAECIVDADCATVDPDACVLEAAQGLPDWMIEPIVHGICEKRAMCFSEDMDQCIAEQSADPEIILIKSLRDDLHRCVGDCLVATECGRLRRLGDDLVFFCAATCGVEPDVDTGCIDIFGDWHAGESRCDGIEVQPGTMSITQRVEMDCTTRLDINDGGCNRGYPGAYVVESPTSITWSLDSRDCDSCQPNECSPASGLGLVIPVSYEISGEDNLSSTFTVTQAVVDEQLSPCQLGEEYFTIFSPGRR